VVFESVFYIYTLYKLPSSPKKKKEEEEEGLYACQVVLIIYKGLSVSVEDKRRARFFQKNLL
jgi:hypothetical protein